MMSRKKKVIWYLTETILVPIIVSILTTWLFIKVFYY